jgi:hypothetical protein
MPRYFHPVIARKTFNGVKIGYLVGWKHRHCNFVRNIRADLMFKTETQARKFRDSMEAQRIDPYPEFEILDD